MAWKMSPRLTDYSRHCGRVRRHRTSSLVSPFAGRAERKESQLYNGFRTLGEAYLMTSSK